MFLQSRQKTDSINADHFPWVCIFNNNLAYILNKNLNKQINVEIAYDLHTDMFYCFWYNYPLYSLHACI